MPLCQKANKQVAVPVYVGRQKSASFTDDKKNVCVIEYKYLDTDILITKHLVQYINQVSSNHYIQAINPGQISQWIL